MALLRPDTPMSWATFRPAQQPLGCALLTGASAVDGLLEALPVSALRLTMRAQDPDVSPLLPARAGDDVDVYPVMHTGRIDLAGSFDDYWRSRRKSLRKELRRQRRRLDREGVEVGVVVTTAPDAMADEIARYAALESAGWKGRHGSAIEVGDAQGQFYRDAMTRFARRGAARVYRLVFDGRTVASQLCIEQGRMAVVLKMTYDEDYRRDAPGFLLREAMLRELFRARRVDSLELYGHYNDGWTDKWATEIRPLWDVALYRYTWVKTGRDLLRAVRSAAARQ